MSDYKPATDAELREYRRKTAERKVKRNVTPDGFDVTCVVGRVTFGQGDMTPHEAALRVIGAHGAEGTFTFPHEDGRTVTVTVEIG